MRIIGAVIVVVLIVAALYVFVFGPSQASSPYSSVQSHATTATCTAISSAPIDCANPSHDAAVLSVTLS